MAPASRPWAASAVVRPGRSRGGFPPGSGDVHADDGAVRGRADLHQVAELVRDPEAAAARVVGRRGAAAGERILEAAAVAQLADDAGAVAPEPQRDRPVAVLQAVRRDLVDREHELELALAREPERPGALGHEVAHRAEPL